MRITNNMRDACCDLFTDRFDASARFETAGHCIAAGLMTWGKGGAELTAAGLAIVEETRTLRAQQRASRNAAARARHAALTSVGLRRTPYGYE